MSRNYQEIMQHLLEKGIEGLLGDHKHETLHPLVMICWQNYSGVRMAKLIPSDKYDIANDEDFNLKISTLGLFFPLHKDVFVPGIKFSNVPK